jgi:GTPase SAR1 family protein
MYYRGAAAAILVYDITREASFKTLQSWVEELQQKGPKEIALAIAGNKADLVANRVGLITISLIMYNSKVN